MWFMILTNRYESNPEASVGKDFEKFMSLKKDLLPNTIGISRYFAKHREIGFFYLIAEIRNLLIIYERLECSNSALQSNNHTLSHFLNKTYFPGIWENLFLETPDCYVRYPFLRNMFVGLYIYHILQNVCQRIG